MSRRIDRSLPFLFVATAALLGPGAGAAEPGPELARLRRHVATLASAEFLGRRGPGGEKAAQYLVGAFQDLGLKPLFGGSFLQTIPGRDGAPAQGRNVGAVLLGADPELRDEWVIVSAHYDHLGTRGGVVYPGADDNASGVAMMLEVARSFAESPEKPRRSLMFVGFDLEEVGLFGSRYFVEHPPVPLSRVALFLTADMIGRSLGGVCSPYVFVMGTEHAPSVRPAIEHAARGEPVNVGLLGSDLLLLARSDYGPFRARDVPYLFFSTGENPLYHTTRDDPETLDYPKLASVSRVIYRVVRGVAGADQRPGWTDRPVDAPTEARTLRDVLRTLLDNQDALQIGSTQAAVMSRTLRHLDAINARGAMTADERVNVIRVVRLIMISLF